MKASSASENGPYATNQRPFFYAQPTAQQPFPNPWFLGPVYNPYGIPAAGVRSGNPYFPFYSVPVQEYSGYLVPQHPVQMRVNRSPYFNSHPPPMFYQATRFRHYNPGKRTETKETQTDPKQPENKQKKHQDHSTETKGCDAGNEACTSSGNGLGIESSLEKPDRAVSPSTSDRDFAKSSSGAVQFRTLPPPGYAFEKEEVRIEYGNGGTPAIQLWKSFKETIPLYDVAKKPVTENVMQRDMFALSSCEGVVYGPREQVELVPSISYPEEQRAVEAMQEKESQYRTKLDSEKGAADPRAASPLDEARAVQLAEPTRPDQLGTRQDGVTSKRFSGSKRSSGSKAQDASNLARQRELFPSGMEITNDLYCPQKLNENDVARENFAASEKSLWCDESEKYIPTESWLACLDNMNANFNYNMYLSQRKRPSVLSITSDEKSSVDEGSSTDNVSVSYYVSDYLPQNKYTFKRSTNGLEREKIRSGGSLNEDEEMVRREQAPTGHRQHSKNWSSVKIKELSSRSRKSGILPRSSSSKHLCALKKKATKSLSPSEADDSEEYWVEEEEEEEEDDDEEEVYLNPEGPRRTLTPSKSGLYWQAGQKVICRVPKNVAPGHLISWPVQDKIKMPRLAARVKEPDQAEDVCADYTYWLKRPSAQGLERRRNSQKCSGRFPKDGGKLAADDYWVKSGARPKFASLVNGGLSPTSRTSERGTSKKKGIRKPPHKRRDTRHDSDEVEEWEKPKSIQRKGRAAKKSLYKRR